MLVTPATMADVRHIGQTLWKRGVEELDALGIDPATWLTDWLLRINRGNAVCIGGHALLGCDLEPDGEAVNTSFQASQSFELPGIGRQVTRLMRAEIPRLMQERGIKESRTYSLCIHPEAEKWFRLLGLDEDTQFSGPLVGRFRLRRFVRRV